MGPAMFWLQEISLSYHRAKNCEAVRHTLGSAKGGPGNTARRISLEGTPAFI